MKSVSAHGHIKGCVKHLTKPPLTLQRGTTAYRHASHGERPGYLVSAPLDGSASWLVITTDEEARTVDVDVRIFGFETLDELRKNARKRAADILEQFL